MKKTRLTIIKIIIVIEFIIFRLNLMIMLCGSNEKAF